MKRERVPSLEDWVERGPIAGGEGPSAVAFAQSLLLQYYARILSFNFKSAGNFALLWSTGNLQQASKKRK